MSIAVAIEQIKTADLSPKTRLNAYSLVQAVHGENGYICISRAELAHMFGCSWDRTRSHLGEMQAVNLIHYSTNGDSLVYLTFKAWTPASRVDDRKTPIKSSKNDHPRAENDHGRANDENGSDHPRAKNDHGRAKNDHPRADSYTHADTRSGWLVGSTTDPDPGKQPTNPPIDPDEQELTKSLLTAIRMIPNNANHLAKTYQFELVREVVGHWWMRRLSVGGTLNNEPGFVVKALLNPAQFGIEPLSDAFRRTDLYRQFRTPAEIAQDEERERQAISPPPAPARASPTDGASPFLDHDPAWLGLSGDPLVEELAGLVEICAVDGVPLYRFAAKDPLKSTWLDGRIGTRLRKRVKMIVHEDVEVEIVTPEEAESDR